MVELGFSWDDEAQFHRSFLLQQIRDGGDPMLGQDQGLGASRRCGGHEAEDRRCRAGELKAAGGKEDTHPHPSKW